MLLYENAFEEHWFVERFLRPGMTVLDIGANQGYYTLLCARKVGPCGKVFAFEPSPRELRHLKLHLWLNGCKNVEVSSSALGASAETVELHVVLGTETGCNSLRPPVVSQPTDQLSVQVDRLDDVLKTLGVERVDFIKLDVEGAELDVLRGASRTLQVKPRPVVMSEMESVRTAPWGYKPEEIATHLQNLCFRWFQPTVEGNLLSLPNSGYTFEGNYVAVPEERLTQIAAFL